MDELNSLYSLIIVVRRMLLSDTAFQDNCLLLYCAMEWRTLVLIRIHLNVVSSETALTGLSLSGEQLFNKNHRR